MERGLAGMTPCPQCGLNLPEGSSFCYQCGTHVGEGELGASRREADATPPEFGLAGAEKIPRFTPHAADEPTCRFCKGPLDLDGEFCEQCGAPVSEAAPSGWVKPATVAYPATSRESAPPEPKSAAPSGLDAPKGISSPAALSSVATPSVPPPAEQQAGETKPLNAPAPGREDHPRSFDGKPARPNPNPQALRLAPTPPTSAQAFAPKALAVEIPKVTRGQLPKTVIAPLPKIAAPRAIAEPRSGTAPIISMPLSVPVRGEESPAQPKKPYPNTVPSAASLAGSPAAKVTSSPATLSYAPSPSLPPRMDETILRTLPPTIPPLPRAHQLRSLEKNPGKVAPTLSTSPPAPSKLTLVRAPAPAALPVEAQTVVVGQLGKTVAALLRQNAALCEIAGSLPSTAPTVHTPIALPVAGEPIIPAPPKKPFPFILVGGIAGLLMAMSVTAGWHVFHPKAQSARFGNVTPPQIQSSAPTALVAAPASEPVSTTAAASELAEERPQAPSQARKPRRVKVVTLPKPAAAAPAPDPKAAQLVSLQTLALDACAKGTYVEPRGANAIAYSQQALALDPTNAYTRTILENSIKGGEFQVRQAIASKDFTTAQRLTDLLAQLTPGDSGVADLKADLARAEKTEEESRRASQAPSAILSFHAFHTHSGKGTGDKGSYCRGTLSVVGGRLKYVGETAVDGQVHSFDFACSEVEVKKNLRVAFWEKGFHVRTSSGNMNFVPEDSAASNIRALASACSQ